MCAVETRISTDPFIRVVVIEHTTNQRLRLAAASARVPTAVADERVACVGCCRTTHDVRVAASACETNTRGAYRVRRVWNIAVQAWVQWIVTAFERLVPGGCAVLYAAALGDARTECKHIAVRLALQSCVIPLTSRLADALSPALHEGRRQVAVERSAKLVRSDCCDVARNHRLTLIGPPPAVPVGCACTACDVASTELDFRALGSSGGPEAALEGCSVAQSGVAVCCVAIESWGLCPGRRGQCG